ncbi:OX-2 membrane glycoprotein [Xenopus laevis]|uniref:OX-2 membrane glycoprotein n=1 Tax=Xenopus laevis TaxID=8355 RepID=A0A8J0UHL9_XENLA|nr:OX-2 membrane glycoprotein [Xenopus laevis]
MNLLDLCLLCSLSWNLTAGSQVLCSADKSTAPVGGSVTMQCRLNLNSAKPDVLQVTWSKQSGEFAGTIATSSRSHGQRFLGPYSQREVRFSEETQDLSAITISSVTPGDRGCFQCIFNVYPLGASMGSVCLDITETRISDPKLDVNSSAEYHVISCSATGKPAPTITWNLTETPKKNPQNYSIIHPDQTVTVISNFTLATLRRMERINITCFVHHSALGSDIVLSKAIEDSDNHSFGKENTFTTNVAVLVIVVIIVTISLVFIIVHQRWKMCKYNQNNGIGTGNHQVKEKPKDQKCFRTFNPRNHTLV